MLLVAGLVLAVVLLLSLIRLLLATLLATTEFRKRLFAFGKEHFCLCRREEERRYNTGSGHKKSCHAPSYLCLPCKIMVSHKLDMLEVQSLSSYVYSGLILAPFKHSRFSTTIFLYPDSPRRYCIQAH